jgi:hypothetical protein
MALNFPSNPSNNQIFIDETSGNRYKFNAIANVWSYASNNSIQGGSINTQVIYNDAGAANGHPGLTFRGTANTLTANTINAFSIRVTGNLYVGTNTVIVTNDAVMAQSFFIMDNGAPIAVSSGATTNTSYEVANAAFGHSNSTLIHSQAVYAAVNSAFGVVNAAFASANNVAPQIAPAFNTANAAFGVANTVTNYLPLSGGTLSNTVFIRGYTGGTAGSLMANYTKSFVIGGPYNQTYNSANAVLMLIADYSNDAGDNVYPIYVEDENNIVDFYLYAGADQTIASKRAYLAGSLGVGTTTPGYKLDVSGIINTSDQFRASGGGGDVRLNGNYGGTTAVVGTVGSTGFGIMTSNDPSRLWITSGGNVGIGTTSPSQKLHVVGTGFASSDFRSPIFYDSDNTAFYVDAAGDSRISNITNNMQLFGGYGSGSGPGLTFENQTSFIRFAFWDLDFYDWNIGSVLRLNSFAQSDTSMRAPIFYDSNDTYYYNDLNSSRRFAGRTYIHEWIEFVNFTGLYSPNNGAHFHPNDATYGSWKCRGSRNGWQGIEFETHTTLMMNDDTYGFHKQGTGWRFYVTGGNGYFPGNVVAYWSDRRLKENLRPIGKEATDILSKLTAYRFNWNEKVKDFNIEIQSGKEEIGLIAQEVQSILPDAVQINKSANKVKTDGNQEESEYLTINWNKITPLLVQALNDTTRELNELKQLLKDKGVL